MILPLKLQSLMHVILTDIEGYFCETILIN